MVVAKTASLEAVGASTVSTPSVWQGVRIRPLLITLAVGLGLWMLPVPEGMPVQAWRFFAIFSATIVGIIVRPLPVSPVVLGGVVVALLTKTAVFTEVFSAFNQSSVWLIGMAFFLARGLTSSGLANRVAYHFISILGRTPLGLGYGFLASEMVLAPFIPSLAARSGGIIFPLAKAVAREQESEGKPSRAARYLMQTAFQGASICSAMFLTGMAGNPVMVQLAAGLGIEISWGGWALAAAVPGAVCALAMPLVLYWLIRPESGATQSAPQMAREKLAALGPMSNQEWTMLGCFGLVLSLWLFGPQFGIGSATAILIGVTLILSTGLLQWKDCLEETAAWDTLIWLGLLVGMGGHLKDLGFFEWTGQSILWVMGGWSWYLALPTLAVIYFCSHYLFASNVGHAAAMYLAFVVTGIEVGAPPLLSALLFAFLTSLFGGITHYASAPAPIFFGANYFSVKEWWGYGAVVGFINLGLFLSVGAVWWWIIGLWG